MKLSKCYRCGATACDCGYITITNHTDIVVIPEDPQLTIQLLESRICTLESRLEEATRLLKMAKDLITNRGGYDPAEYDHKWLSDLEAFNKGGPDVS